MYQQPSDRELVRQAVISALQTDLDGDEQLMKEVWEVAEDREEARDELRAIIQWLEARSFDDNRGMLPKGQTDHVVLKGDAFTCLHCGDSWAFSLPVDLDVLIAAGEAYRRRHWQCPKAIKDP